MIPTGLQGLQLPALDTANLKRAAIDLVARSNTHAGDQDREIPDRILTIGVDGEEGDRVQLGRIRAAFMSLMALSRGMPRPSGQQRVGRINHSRPSSQLCSSVAIAAAEAVRSALEALPTSILQDVALLQASQPAEVSSSSCDPGPTAHGPTDDGSSDTCCNSHSGRPPVMVKPTGERLHVTGKSLGGGRPALSARHKIAIRARLEHKMVLQIMLKMLKIYGT